MRNFTKEPTEEKEEEGFTSMRDNLEIKKLRDWEEYLTIEGWRWFNRQTIKKEGDTHIDWDCENLVFVSLIFLGNKQRIRALDFQRFWD